MYGPLVASRKEEIVISLQFNGQSVQVVASQNDHDVTLATITRKDNYGSFILIPGSDVKVGEFTARETKEPVAVQKY